MKSSPISIIIPTYNRAHLVSRAVRSVLASCREEDEIIVVDDGSTDNISEVLQPLLQRVRYVRLPHGGAGRARNQGVQIASSPLLAFLDSDDELIPGYLEAKRRLLDARSDLVFCFSEFGTRFEDGRVEHDALSRWHHNPPEWREVLSTGVNLSSLIALPPGVEDAPVHVCNMYHLEMAANYISAITLVVRKDAARDNLRFAEDLPTFEDWECYGRLAKCGLGAFLECETAWQHRHSGTHLTHTDPVTRARTRIKILQRIWGSDPDYLAQHGGEFERVLREQQHFLIRALLLQAKLQEAREMIAQTSEVPLSWRFLSHMPVSVIRNASQARSALRRVRHLL